MDTVAIDKDDLLELGLDARCARLALGLHLNHTKNEEYVLKALEAVTRIIERLEKLEAT